MKPLKLRGLAVMVFLCVVTAALFAYTDVAPAQSPVRYKKEECVQCHAGRVNEIATAGGKHRSVPCFGCHVGHPPDVPKPFAPCTKCHLTTRKSHFETAGCLNCHTNPHTPLKITFKVKDGCLNCHGLQVEQLRDNVSKHSSLDCSTCHDVHRKIPQCTQCHKPHSGKVTGGCNKCHNPHMPRLVMYSADIPSKDCGMCHQRPAELLGATTSRHKPIECSRCHQGKHRMVPACKDCHGSPHPAGIMVKFPKCGMCHNTAHDLNNWSLPAIKTSAQSTAATTTVQKP